MRALGASGIMLAMTRPAPFTSSRLLLIADSRRAMPEPAGFPVRRYRLARLRLEARPTEPSRRFEHLKRVFD
jgi:hypothetical protein